MREDGAGGRSSSRIDLVHGVWRLLFVDVVERVGRPFLIDVGEVVVRLVALLIIALSCHSLREKRREVDRARPRAKNCPASHLWGL